MKYSAIKYIIFLLLMSVFTFQASSVGLQDYLQNSESGAEVAPIVNASSVASTLTNSPVINSNETILKIIELVVAGVVASALIVSLLALFLGRWLARKDKKLIQEFRVEAEKNIDHIKAATSSIREHEKETIELVGNMREHGTDFSKHKATMEQQQKEIGITADKIKKQEKELTQLSEDVTKRISDIQIRWDKQLAETISTTKNIQKDLDSNLKIVNDGVSKLQQQKELSQGILQEFLEQHSQQSDLSEENSELTIKVSDKLNKSYKESEKLIKLLNKNQAKVEKSLNSFNEKLSGYEEQAYEQFDTSFQVADLARQELSANIEESRSHVETMRRQEEQSHTLNLQTMKNLESLDYSKIVKISNTLNTTQDIFNEMHFKVEETRSMLDELKEIETDINKTASKVGIAVKDSNAKKKQSADDQHVNKKSVDTTAKKETKVVEKIKSSVVAAGEVESIKEKNGTEKTDKNEEADDNTVVLTDYKVPGRNNPIPFFRNLKH